ncbi:tagaturonate reductase [bacterium]|nr:MAG: tagaturonate reductase [bacterium]
MINSESVVLNLPTLNKSIFEKKERPERILMFGTGGFLRGFASTFVDEANERGDFDGSIVMVQSTNSTRAKRLNEQDGLFTLMVKAFEKGALIEENKVIQSVSRAIIASEQWDNLVEVALSPRVEWVISNTTEKGLTIFGENEDDLVVPKTFPGKLCSLMYQRYKAGLDGWIILPCELLTQNGQVLHSLIVEIAKKWNYEQRFFEWLEMKNQFCSSLVDRIIPGDPNSDEQEGFEKELGYKDDLITVSEKYRLWAIEGNPDLYKRLPFVHHEASIIVKPDISLYAVRKLRLLNATHTIFVPYMILQGMEIVAEVMQDADAEKMIKSILFDESGKVLSIPEQEISQFANEVLDRFRNPFLKHELSQIAFQSTSKWMNRVYPLVQAYVDKFGELPPMIVRGFAGLLRYNYAKYPNEKMNGEFKGKRYVIADEAFPKYQSFWNDYLHHNKLNALSLFLSDTSVWNENLTHLPGFVHAVASELELLMKA